MTSFSVRPAKGPLAGRVQIPGDKSIGHRALLFAAIADGKVAIRGLSSGADNQRSRRAIEILGARVDEQVSGEVVVHGVGLDGLRAPTSEIECGNSGTTMRLLAGLLAGQTFASRLVGDESLTQRPMRRVIGPLSEMGAVITGRNQGGDVYPPLEIAGRGERGLSGIRYQQPVASAQVKTALLLAGLYAEGATTVIEPAQARDHTERMLAHMGAPITVEGDTITLDPTGWDRRLKASAFSVPGDPSSAAFLVAAALIAGAERVAVADVCVNRRRTGFLDVLAAFGALVEQECRSDAGGEPTADLVVSRGGGDRLEGTAVAGDLTVRALDELPILAVVAARAEGDTDFRDAGELRVKESDRIASTTAMLRALGVEVDEREDGFTVHGRGPRPFKACRIDSVGDHRIAMSAAVAALAADGEVRIDDADNVTTSFPRFAAVLRELGAEIEVLP